MCQHIKELLDGMKCGWVDSSEVKKGVGMGVGLLGWRWKDGCLGVGWVGCCWWLGVGVGDVVWGSVCEWERVSGGMESGWNGDREVGDGV